MVASPVAVGVRTKIGQITARHHKRLKRCVVQGGRAMRKARRHKGNRNCSYQQQPLESAHQA
jgi:hypothetical protein